MEEQYLAAIPVPVHSMEIDYNSAAEPDREFADSRLCTGEISDATTLEKTDRCSSSEWEKIWMYVFDTQEKTDPRNTNRFLLSHGKLRSFWVSGKEWTFSCTVCVDPPWDDSEDLVEISRGKFMDAEGARERPDAIEYLSVHCDVSPLVLCSLSEARKAPVRGYLQTVHTNWNSPWKRWLPYFAWDSVRGACAAMRSSKKPWPRYNMTYIVHSQWSPGAGPLWIEMLVQGEVGRNNAGRQAGRASASSSGSSRARSSTSRFGKVFYAVCYSPGHRARNSDSTSIHYYDIRELKKTFKFNSGISNYLPEVSLKW